MMQMHIEAGHVHGEPVLTFSERVSANELQEEGWEACETTIRRALAQAELMMHPELNAWVTVEWTWTTP